MCQFHPIHIFICGRQLVMSSSTTLFIHVKVCSRVLHFTNWRTLEHSWAPLSFSLWIVAKLLCFAFVCSFDTIIELPCLRATSNTRLKAHDLWNLRVLIGRKGGDRPSSLHTRRWRPKSPKKTSHMKNLRGVLHGRLWIWFHGLLEFFVKPTSKRWA